MEDNRAAFKTIKASDRIVQIGSQRRSGANYQAASEFIQSGKFGPIKMVELTWNVNQPGRWRRPALVAQLREEDTDWKRWLLGKPYTPFDPWKYFEFRTRAHNEFGSISILHPCLANMTILKEWRSLYPSPPSLFGRVIVSQLIQCILFSF